MGETLYDSELKVMEVLWEHGPLPAKEIVAVLAGQIGWNKNTTYTVIKKCQEKGYLKREEPGFLCTPLVTREQAQSSSTDALINKMFGGSSQLFFSAFLKSKGLEEWKVRELLRMIDEMK